MISMDIQEKAIELANARLRVRDKNGNGKISKQELKDFYLADEDLKKYINSTAIVAIAEHYFDTLDKNKEGFISLEEMI